MKERIPVQTSMLGIAKKAKSDKRYRFRNLYRLQFGGYHHLVEADIKGFFDNLSHE